MSNSLPRQAQGHTSGGENFQPVAWADSPCSSGPRRAQGYSISKHKHAHCGSLGFSFPVLISSLRPSWRRSAWRRSKIPRDRLPLPRLRKVCLALHWGSSQRDSFWRYVDSGFVLAVSGFGIRFGSLDNSKYFVTGREMDDPEWVPFPGLSYSSYISYDSYVQVGFGDYPEVVAHDTGMTLEEFGEEHDFVVTRNNLDVEDGFPLLPGENDALVRYQITAEVTKKIARTMLKALRLNQGKKSFFSDFDSTNVLVSRTGKVTFRDVRIITPAIHLADGPIPDVMTLLQGTRRNVMSVHDIIRYILFNGNPPDEILDLLELMQFDRHREIYHVHGSLVPITTYPALFKECYDQVRFVIPKDQMRDILRDMPYVEDWQISVRTNDLLMKTFNFNAKSYTVPTSSDKQTCLNKDQKAALYDLDLTATRKQKGLTEEQVALLKALHFLDYLRNRTHRMEAYQEWVNEGKLPFNSKGSERITFLRFPRVTGYLQVRLQMLGRLKELDVERFF